MDSDQKFWLGFYGIVGVVIVAIAVTTRSYWVDHNTKVVGLIKAGVPAVEALCALQDDYGNHPTCLVLAVKRGQP